MVEVDQLEPAMDPEEGWKRARDEVGRDSETGGERYGGESVFHVVEAREREPSREEMSSVAEDVEFGPACGAADIRGGPVGRGGDREGFDLTGEITSGSGDGGVACPNGEEAVRREGQGEFPEGRDGVVERREVVEVIGFDAENDAVGGGEFEEIAAVFTTFDDEVVARSAFAAPMGFVSRFGTDDNGGGTIGSHEEMSEDGGRGALAVRAGDYQSATVVHQMSEEIVVGDLMDAEFRCTNAFGIAGGNGGAVDEELRVGGECAGVMSGSDFDATRLECEGTSDGDFILIGTGQFPARVGEEFREGFHPGTADTDEMRTEGLREIERKTDVGRGSLELGHGRFPGDQTRMRLRRFRV